MSERRLRQLERDGIPTFACPTCAKPFRSRAGVRTHHWRVHGDRLPISSEIPRIDPDDPRRCPACGGIDHEIVDPLVPDPGASAAACGRCGTVYRRED